MKGRNLWPASSLRDEGGGWTPRLKITLIEREPVHAELILEDEPQRLEAVRRYEILDTPPDGVFDRITALAAKLFGVPICIISIVDHDRIWFKSHHGIDVEQIDREPGLCASAILHGEPWIVTDARTDPRTLANPLVSGELGLQFYAAIPLVTSDGYKLGTFNIIDTEPREMSEDETQTLKELAQIVMDELELRLEARRLFSSVRSRQRQGMELNDNVVQQLTIAKLALENEDMDMVKRAVSNALSASTTIASRLVEDDSGREVVPGDLIRAEAAGGRVDSSRN